MGFCPDCGAKGSVFEVYRRTPPHPWRLHEYRVIHDKGAHDGPCFNPHGLLRTYCRISPKGSFPFHSGNFMRGGGFLKTRMIERSASSLGEAFDREMAPIRGTEFDVDGDALRVFLMPRGWRNRR